MPRRIAGASVWESPQRAASRRRSALLDDLGLDLDGDLLADDHTTRLEGLVVGEAPVLAVDLGAGVEAGPAHAPRVGEHTLELHLQGDGLARAVDGEVAVDLEVVALDVAHRGAGEGELRVALGL